jgi:nucleoside-diphosphate-sugar epimerase
VKILVTGGTGFVGSHAAAELQRSGHCVRLLARNPAKVAGVLGPLGAVADEVVKGDMTDADAVAEALEGCDAVLHCAAEIGVAGGRGPTSDANIEGTRLVIDGALDGGLDPVVYTSTVTVHLPTTDAVLGPESPLAEPLSVYGAQKCAIEQFVQQRQRAGAPVTTLVVGGVYGPASPHLDGSFSAILASLESGMYAPDSGLGVVDVRDLALVIGRALEPGRGPRRYLVSGRYVTWEDWAALLAEASGRPVPYHRASPEDMITLGRKFDELRAAGEDLPPLSEEAAIVMSSGRPGDDAATLAAFGVAYRPTLETFRDSVGWLRDAGHLKVPSHPTRAERRPPPDLYSS